MFLELLKSKLFRVILALILLAGGVYGAYELGHSRGIQEEKVVYAQAQAKAQVIADKKAVQKQQTLQTKTDQSEKVQIVYKDRIVKEYVPIEQKVTEYAQKENENPANVTWLDGSFVGLFNDAAKGGTNQDQASRPTSEPAGKTTTSTKDNSTTRVSSGQVLQVITENDKQYQQCVRELNGWQDWYAQLQAEYNK